MTFEQYWTILLKRWRLIVICFLLVGAGAAVATKLITPLYQSAALVQVVVGSGNNQSDYTSLLASEQLVQTEAILATSDPVLREVASHYKGLTVEQLSKESTTAPKLNSQLFEIDVLDPIPTRAAALANDIAATLLKQQLQLTQQSNLLVVQAAQPSLKPAQPNIFQNTGVGLLSGLLLGTLLAVLFEQLDTRVRTQEALAQFLGWSVLGTVWRADLSKKEPVIHPTGRDANVEAYRILRTNIGFSSIDKPLRSLVVTSALPGEGKSVIAANLAIFMAKAGKNTLLVDANLRHSTMYEQLGLSADKMGLSNAVLAFGSTPGKAPSYDQPFSPATSMQLPDAGSMANIALHPFIHSVNIPNLWVMPSGPLPPNPPELLDSKAAQLLLAEIANSGIEVVIFDTPPLLGLSDASIMASKVDGTLVVVDITRANKKIFKQLKAVLAQAEVRVLGCVVNKQSRSSKDATSYYYGTGDQNGVADRSIENGNLSTAPVEVSPQLAITQKLPSNKKGREKDDKKYFTD